MPTNQRSSASAFRSSLSSLRRRGVGLIEASLFVVISLGLIAGGIVFFQQTSEATRVNDAVQSIVSIQSGVRSLYVSEASFGADGANLIEAAVASGAVTANMVQSDGSVRNQWGGAVTITGHPNTFVVNYDDVPQSACVRLAPHTSAGTGPAGNGIASIAINGVLVDEDGDGNVSPTEAEAACALNLASAEPLRMKWAFLADANMKTSAWEVETALGIDPEETDRENEVESRACGTGFMGNESRSRDHVTLSNGATAPTDWTEWDRSSCVEIVESSRRTETENGACPTGMIGQTTRTREVIVMSDGEERIGAWSDWNTSDCEIVEVSRRTESENGTCPTGLAGTATRSREIAVMSDGSEQPQAWSSWNNSQCLVVEVSRRTESQDGTCPTGLVGKATRTREVAVMSDGTEQPQAWSSWNNSQCLVVKSSERTETESGACPSGYLGNASRTRTVWVMSNGTEQPQAWSGWNNAACYIGEVSRYTQNDSAACPSGYLGTQSRSRIVLRMSNGTEQPQAWSGWNTGACYIGEVSRYTGTETAACGSGYTGNQTRTQTVIVLSNGAHQGQGNWSAWNRSACVAGK